jgi:hypothetical protein
MANSCSVIWIPPGVAWEEVTTRLLPDAESIPGLQEGGQQRNQRDDRSIFHLGSVVAYHGAPRVGKIGATSSVFPTTVRLLPCLFDRLRIQDFDDAVPMYTFFGYTFAVPSEFSLLQRTC